MPIGARTKIKRADDNDNLKLADRCTNKYHTIQRAMVGQCFGDADFSQRRPRTCKAVASSARLCYIQVDIDLVNILNISIADLEFDMRSIADMKDRHWSSLMQTKDSRHVSCWPVELDESCGLNVLENKQGKNPLEKSDLGSFEYKLERKGILRMNPLKVQHSGYGKQRYVDFGLKNKVHKREARPKPSKRYNLSTNRTHDMLENYQSINTRSVREATQKIIHENIRSCKPKAWFKEARYLIHFRQTLLKDLLCRNCHLSTSLRTMTKSMATLEIKLIISSS